MEQRVKELEQAINSYLDSVEAWRDTDLSDTDAATRGIEAMKRAEVGMMKAVGRTIDKPDFEDDDMSWHIGISPEDAEAEWMEVYGEVAASERESNLTTG